jgi:hypothetical protein
MSEKVLDQFKKYVYYSFRKAVGEIRNQKIEEIKSSGIENDIKPKFIINLSDVLKIRERNFKDNNEQIRSGETIR